MKKSNILSVILDCLKIPHTDIFARTLYEEHPHDSLFAISRLLDVYGVSSTGIMLGNKQEIAKICPPFVAQYKEDLIVVTEYSGPNVIFSISGDKQEVPVKVFIERCSGALLIIENNINSGEPGFTKNWREEKFRTFTGIILPICLLYLGFIPVLKGGLKVKTGEIIELLLYLVGVILCYSLVMKELALDTPLANKLCSVMGSKGGCGDVKNSDKLKFAGIIGLAEIGLGYFFASVFIISFCRDLLPWVRFLNSCTLSFIPWSLWYQMRKLNKWCPLCLSVLAIFLLLFVNSLSFGLISFHTANIVDLVEVFVILLASILSVNYVVLVIAETGRLKIMTSNLIKVKYGDTAFEAILKSQPHYNVSTTSSCIIFGNPDSSNLITVVTNPHCDPCGRIHDKIAHLIQKRGDSICIQYFFINFKKKEMANSGKFLISAYLQGGKEKALTIYERWFGGERANVSQIIDKFNFETESEDVLKEQKRHEDWCAEHSIFSTPTILVNGYRLPYEYDLNDLLFIL